jgi:L-aspartate oxidase
MSTSTSTSAKIFDTDVLIIGSGLAGLLLALKLVATTDLSLVLISKGGLLDSNSSYAQGGVAAVTHANPLDSPDSHLIDTLKSGAGLTDELAAGGIIFSGARLISELAIFGVEFDRNTQGLLETALEGGHSQARVLHNKDATGRAVTTILTGKLKQLALTRPNIQLLEHTYVNDLLLSDGACIGAKLTGFRGEQCVLAPYTVLATGGAGQIFSRTTNPAVATGDGVALAYRAGATLTDMEFVQFHPTALRKDNAPPFLISEAVRGAGATLIDRNGRRFLQRFHQDGELATRDIVSRAIHAVMREYEDSEVFLDLRPIGAATIKERFPNIIQTCGTYGVDVLSQPIPVAPAAHYMMGGVAADLNGRTSVPGLYAIGETACIGLHGANRLASNSLLEAGVMALNAANAIARENRHLNYSARRSAFLSAIRPQKLLLPSSLESFRTLMYRHAGIVRSNLGLSMILQESDAIESDVISPENCSARNIYQVGKLIALAALARRESRGAHLREDYPQVDSRNYTRHFSISTEFCGWNGLHSSVQIPRLHAATGT